MVTRVIKFPFFIIALIGLTCTVILAYIFDKVVAFIDYIYHVLINFADGPATDLCLWLRK